MHGQSTAGNAAARRIIMQVDVLITADISIVFASLLKKFQANKTIAHARVGDRGYVTMSIPNGSETLDIAFFQLHLGTMGTVSMAIDLADAIGELRPRFVILSGLAGAASDDVQIGDIVVASEVFESELHKSIEAGSRYLTTSVRTSDDLLNVATTFALTPGSWMALRDPSVVTGANPRVHIGSMVSSDAVYKAHDRLHNYGTLAVEMEGSGVRSGIADRARESGGSFMVIRGISDLASSVLTTTVPRDDSLGLAADTVASYLAGLLMSGLIKPTSKQTSTYKVIVDGTLDEKGLREMLDHVRSLVGPVEIKEVKRG
jgi:nucleoside phosphorylase